MFYRNNAEAARERARQILAHQERIQGARLLIDDYWCKYLLTDEPKYAAESRRWESVLRTWLKQ